jgi:hypothetical protein
MKRIDVAQKQKEETQKYQKEIWASPRQREICWPTTVSTPASIMSAGSKINEQF